MPQDGYFGKKSDNLPEIRSIGMLALGSNQSLRKASPTETIAAAIKCLKTEGLLIRGVSGFFATPCFPAGAGPDYVNAAVCVETTLTAKALLEIIHRIEAEFGRERIQRWGQRTLDIDLIGMEETVMPDIKTHDIWRNLPPESQINHTPDQLILPHPRLQDRAFVLVPLADIAPNWMHPVLGQSIRDLCHALPKSLIDEVSRL